MSNPIDYEKENPKETLPQGISADPADRRHERGDVNIRAILISVGVLASGIAVVMAVLVLVFNVMEGRAEKKDGELSPVADTNAFPPAPRLQPSPPTYTTEAQDLAALRAHEDTALATYGWVDKPNGVARIPIDSAMAIIARRGTGAAPATGADGTQRADTVAVADSAAQAATNAPPGGALEKGGPNK